MNIALQKPTPQEQSLQTRRKTSQTMRATKQKQKISARRTAAEETVAAVPMAAPAQEERESGTDSQAIPAAITASSSNEEVVEFSFTAGGAVDRLLHKPTPQEQSRQTLISTAGKMRENARNQRIHNKRSGPMGTFSRDAAAEPVAAPVAAAQDSDSVTVEEQPGLEDLLFEAWKHTDDYRDL